MVGVKRKAEHFGDGAVWERDYEIGSGIYSSVFLGKVRKARTSHKDWPESVAVKSAKMSTWPDSLFNERDVFEDLCHGGGCPYIIKCYGHEITTSSEGEKVFNLILEEGIGNLSNHMSIDGMPKHLVKFYTKNILEGVKHIHDRGYVHCDIKPENILLMENPNKDGIFRWVAKVADLGLTKKKNSGYAGSLGTWIYFSPEALEEDAQEQPSDIWAVGCVVLQMLTGVRPSDAFYDWLQGDEDDDKAIVPIDAHDFLKHLLEVDSDKRWTADKLLSHPFVADAENCWPY